MFIFVQVFKIQKIETELSYDQKRGKSSLSVHCLVYGFRNFPVDMRVPLLISYNVTIGIEDWYQYHI